MICKMEVKWEGKHEDLSLEAYNALLRFSMKKEVDKLPNWFYSEEVIGDIEEATKELTPHGFKLSIIGFKNNVFVGIEKFLDAKYPEYVPMPILPNVTHVHIPNIGLLLINEVQHLNDVCTDSLQRELDQGWRILAVCPPNGTRRPDYILGRTKEK